VSLNEARTGGGTGVAWPSNDERTTGLASWRSLWDRLGATVPSAEVCDDLLRRYGERHRAYHTRQHLNECLALLDDARSLCVEPDEVAAALWFHDAIYAPRRADNEVRSADWLAHVSTAAGVDHARVARMHALVMATCHDAVPVDQDAQVLVDIDLSILGAPIERFDKYEQQVRREYRWVPMLIYSSKRAAILAAFLARPRIYSTRRFFDRFETLARDNILRSLSRLG